MYMLYIASTRDWDIESKYLLVTFCPIINTLMTIAFIVKAIFIDNCFYTTYKTCIKILKDEA